METDFDPINDPLYLDPPENKPTPCERCGMLLRLGAVRGAPVARVIYCPMCPPERMAWGTITGIIA
jgi:hypothetical protein